jgi:hypothetical protein
VPAGGYWSYLDERDIMSSLTFLTAAELFQLTLIKASGEGEGPLLTLPVGSGAHSRAVSGRPPRRR